MLNLITEPVTPDISIKDISDIGRNGYRKVTIQWVPSGRAHYDYFVSVTPPTPECVNSSVCTTSSTMIDLNLELKTEHTVSVVAERCGGSVRSEDSNLLTFKLSGTLTYLCILSTNSIIVHIL